MSEGYSGIIDALQNLSEDKQQKGETRREAENIAEKMQELEFAFLLELWNDILERWQMTSKGLQDGKISIAVCGSLLETLATFVEDLKDKFDTYEAKAKEKLPEVDYRACRNRRKFPKKYMDDSSTPHCQLSGRDNFRVTTFLAVQNVLELHLKERAAIYKKVAGDFGFLTEVNMPKEERSLAAEKLIGAYSKDIDKNFHGELDQFHLYIKSRKGEENLHHTHQDIYTIIREDGIQNVFPNVEVILRIFLTLMVTNCTGERSFSCLKRIKNELRNNMGQERLSSLSLLCIEREKLRELDFDDVIHDFAHLKSRKQTI